MSKKRGRGYYLWGNEDNMTPGLFQIWATFPLAIVPVIEAAGVRIIGSLKYLSWAYACEERAFGSKLIPDIVIYFEDHDGPGIVTFEVKRPGVKPADKDVEKLHAYTMLRSMERFMRRKGVFLIGEDQTAAANDIAPDLPVVTWESMLEMQLDATATLAVEDAKRMQPWIRRVYSLYGIGDAQAPIPAHPEGYGTSKSFAAIENQIESERVRNFLWGSEVVEAFLSGHEVKPPLDWMCAAPNEETISLRKWQKTEDRRINRWHPNWQLAYERALP